MTTNEHLRAASGNVTSSSRLVGFLYELMRDKVTPGEIQTFMAHQQYPEEKALYTNGWLANYALYVANQLCPHNE